jgi:hypothetical protein
MARLEHHRDRHDRHERLLAKHYPQEIAAPADLGKLLILKLGMRHEKMVAEWCEEAIEALSALSHRDNLVPLDDGKRESSA